MATTLLLTGLEIELHEGEHFNKVRERVNQALTGTKLDGTKEDDKKRNKPLKKLTFYTDVGDGERGRIAFNPEKFIGVMSDLDKDPGNVRDDDDEEDE